MTARPLPDSMKVAGWMDRLGALVERSPRFWLRLGDWESRLDPAGNAGAAIDRPIHICGLARSGSTILLELLARHSHVATHRYRDFPLVLTPKIWNWFIDRAASRPQPPRERAHADGIDVTPESPEAFEEMIWMAFFPQLHDPARCALLDWRTNNPDFAAFYRGHILKLLQLRGGRRYLAKGNYNITRLGYLQTLFPGARFLIPVRNPVWHIASLMKQHALFCNAERTDARVLRHMRRSGHFEFGLDRRPVNTGDNAAIEAVQSHWTEGREVEGWALYWNMIYRYIADLLEMRPEIRAATLVLRYEDMCAQPRETMARILAHCGLPAEKLPDLAEARLHEPGYYRPCFTPDELDRLRAATTATARRFGYGEVG